MIFLRRIFLTVLAGLIGLLLGGCMPTASSNAEENEAHFLKGKARVSGMDYRGAIESFEEALVVNPRSAAAHFELGILYAEKEPDPAAAIYHYEKYLKFRPGAENADVIRQHIFRLKQELAKALLPLPATPGVQREFEQLAEENRRLRSEVERMKGFLAARGLSLTSAPAGSEPEVQPSAAAGGNAGSRSVGQSGSVSPSSATAVRTHKVQAGESPLSISRKYGVKLEAFMAANPGLNPTKMRIGQTVNVPGQ